MSGQVIRNSILCWFLLLGNSALVFSQIAQYQFSHVDINNGLSHNQVNCFLRDSKGFIWIGTVAGLNRYDGYEFKIFVNIVSDTASIANNNVVSLFEDPVGRIWTYSYFGTSVYDPASGQFIRNTNWLLSQFNIPDGLVTNIVKDSKGRFWFLHQAGLYLYDPLKKETSLVRQRDGQAINGIAEDKSHAIWLLYKDGMFERLDGQTFAVTYTNAALQSENPNGSFDYNLRIDNDDDLWIYISNQNLGVHFFDHNTKELKHYTSNSDVFRLKSDIVRNLVVDDQNVIWVGTDHGGINLLYKKTKSIRYLASDDADNKSISQNNINSLYKDYEGIIWIGTFKKGVNYYHENLIKFDHIYHHPSDPSSLPYDDINNFVEDKKGNLWIATNGGGLLYYNRITNTYDQYLHDPNNSNSLGNNVIVSLCLDTDDNLWIGTYYGGLDYFDGHVFTHYKHNAENPSSLSDNSIWEITEDSQGDIWIGTLIGGLNKFNKKSKTFEHFTNAEGILTGYVPAIMEDSKGTLWVGTGFGLNRLPRGATHFEHVLSNEKEGSISNNSITDFLQDSRGFIWVGTLNGLNLYNPTTDSYKIFREADGLPHNTILTLLEDDKGNLWVSTPNGISTLEITGDPYQKEFVPRFKNYDELDGLQGKLFNENAGIKTRDGELIFGGPNGYNIIRPDHITYNTRTPPIALTDFQIFNKEVTVGEMVDGSVILPQTISEVKSITLKHNENVFSLEFAALSYFHPEKNKYKYKLEGFDKDWVTVDAKSRRVTYTNLDPGTYRFRVIASNSDGYWNEEGIDLPIVVTPPFWKTNIAFGIYIVLIMGALFLTRYIGLNRERLKFKLQQERTEAQKIHELDMVKIRFFTNVSHEFRTPLTLILTPLEKILKTPKYADDKDHFQLIHRNARRLLNLVNQLLDFRRMEVQEIKLNVSEGDLIAFVQDVVNSFSDLSEKKNIHFSFTSTVHSFETFFDQNKIERILFNLISNAFKFTPIGGEVRVAVEVNKLDDSQSLFEMRVIDTGIGIPADMIGKIFDRFFQSELPTTMVNQGSGIGLSITKEFVRIHGGTITATSEVEMGSCFTVRIPVGKIDAEQVTEPISQDILVPMMEVDDQPLLKTSKKAVLLLVEDNEDFRFYLKDNLKQQYQILEAGDGKAGWNLACEHIPDLIVSDVMMPEMDGISLCKKIKSDQRTSHIPVILLTARGAEEQRLEGYQIGADDYVVKPFNFEILQSRIRNLITTRANVHKTFQQQIEIKASEIKISSLDEKLIEKALKLVEDNIAEPDFSVEILSHELGMSRVHLYKKLLSLTGKTPIEFIRTIRLQRAAQLLEKSQLNVSEVAYKVGFNNPKYFARYFKEQYNILPSQYANSKKESGK